MKKEYITPTVEAAQLPPDDIIRTSDWNLPEVPLNSTEPSSAQQKYNW